MKTAEELPESQRSALTASAPGINDPSEKALVERLMVWMPGLSDTEARIEIADRFREFCDRTNCWSVEVSWPLERDCRLQAGWPNVPSGAVALRVRESRCGTQTWQGLPPFVRAEGLPGPHPTFSFGTFPPWVGSLRLRAAALGGEVPLFFVRLVLAPAVGSEALPAALVARYGDAIVSGARAHLSAMPNRPWSDPQGAALHGQKYNAAVAFARGEFECGGVPSHLQARSRTPFLI